MAFLCFRRSAFFPDLQIGTRHICTIHPTLMLRQQKDVSRQALDFRVQADDLGQTWSLNFGSLLRRVESLVPEAIRRTCSAELFSYQTAECWANFRILQRILQNAAYPQIWKVKLICWLVSCQLEKVFLSFIFRSPRKFQWKPYLFWIKDSWSMPWYQIDTTNAFIQDTQTSQNWPIFDGWP